MQKFARRNEVQRSDLILCLGVNRCFRDYNRIISFPWFAPSFSESLPTHTCSPVCNSLFDEKNTQVHAGNDRHFLVDECRLKKPSTLAGFPFLKTFSCRGSSFQRIPSWKAGRLRTLSFSIGLSLLLWIVFHSTLISLRALTFCCPWYAIFHCFFSLCPQTGPRLQGQRRALQVFFREKRNASHRLLLQVPDHHHFQSDFCSLSMSPSEQYLECTETVTASSVLTVEADGIIKISRASSSGCFFFSFIRALLVSTTKDTESSASL